MIENTPNYKREALILAGGLGTRLKYTVPDKPKCLAPVAGQPFLDFVVDHAIKNGVEHIVFCLGYMASLIESHVQERYSGHVAITIVLEEEALGTGGAIKNGAKYIKGDRFFALNGDSLFAIAYDDLEMGNNEQDIIATIGLKPMVNFERYGTVILDDKGMIQSFLEKQAMESGLINGGTYLINKEKFLNLELPEKFSMEKDVLEVYSSQNQIGGVISDAYFIDIGIPEDFEKASQDLANHPLIFEE